ncbi:hypothetical protein I7I48_09312 [Histoplasma ohiense]|nr:hypothetical protein I7I48_09312 [Histoplasma ohiense (nom. inval.)]
MGGMARCRNRRSPIELLLAGALIFPQRSEELPGMLYPYVSLQGNAASTYKFLMNVFDNLYHMSGIFFDGGCGGHLLISAARLNGH